MDSSVEISQPTSCGEELLEKSPLKRFRFSLLLGRVRQFLKPVGSNDVEAAIIVFVGEAIVRFAGKIDSNNFAFLRQPTVT